MCGLADGGSIQAVLCQQVPGGAGAAEHILHAHAAHGGGQLLGQDGAHGFAQTADDVVLLGGDHLAALFGRLQDDLLVQRLDGVDVDDAGMDALGGQLLGSDAGLVDHQAGGDDGNVIALGDLLALADLKVVVVGIVEHRHRQTAEAQVDRAFHGVGGTHSGAGLHVIGGADDGHAGDAAHEGKVLAALIGLQANAGNLFFIC